MVLPLFKAHLKNVIEFSECINVGMTKEGHFWGLDVPADVGLDAYAFKQFWQKSQEKETELAWS